MKKVRYVVGALGVAGTLPALGLIAPGAQAQTAASAGKTVSLHLAGTPQVTCQHDRNSGTFDVGLSGHIGFERVNGCIFSVVGTIHPLHPQRGQDMRVKFWAHGKVVSTVYNKNGGIGHETITWTSFPNFPGVQKVCEAIVPDASKSRVLYGPTCQVTGF